MPSSRASNGTTGSSSLTITVPFSQQVSRWVVSRQVGGAARGLTGATGDPGDLRDQLGWPVEGALFDVEHNAFWYRSWGQRPAVTSEALRAARQHLSRAPKMIPVCGHRYLPAGRGSYGHPVLSIYQTDIIVYGTDLADYINCEFSRWFISADWTPPPMVPFWSDFL
jgi:hypothetical protein